MIRRSPRSTLFPLHDALPILGARLLTTCLLAILAGCSKPQPTQPTALPHYRSLDAIPSWSPDGRSIRSEEHTSELQSQFHLVCRLLLEKKNSEGQNDACRSKL